MSVRSEISPATVDVRVDDAGVTVQYTDGRSVLYRGPLEPTAAVTTPPGKEVHVLVTDPTETEGVLVYVNDRTTADEILRDTGVGRVLLEGGQTTTVFPGVRVTASPNGYRIDVEADHAAVDGRVFVFAEDELVEHAWELVPEDHAEVDTESATEAGLDPAGSGPDHASSTIDGETESNGE